MAFARFVRRALFPMALTGALASAGTEPAIGRTVQIHDTEIEDTIRDHAGPVLRAAGLDPEAVRIHLIRAPVLNAFVAGGQRLFLTTGLLRATAHPGQVVGVIAHELGHIAGGHLAQLDAALRDARTPAMLTTAAAAVLGVLSGKPEAAIAAADAGLTAVNRRLLSFSRAQEQAADRAAVSYLDRSGQSARGLLEFFELLGNRQAMVVSRRDQRALGYEITHPLTADRIDFLRAHVARSEHSDRPIAPELSRRHARMVAKLDGFIDPASRTLAKYPASDDSLSARYARAVALYRKPDVEAARAATAALIAENPDDPYFAELMGQILFESGRAAEALPHYERAVGILPDAPLLRIGLAHAQLETGRAELVEPALGHLRAAMRDPETLSLAWRLAATAYGRLGRIGEAELASAEYAWRSGHPKDALLMARRARRGLKEGSPERLRAEDLIALFEKRQKKR